MKKVKVVSIICVIMCLFFTVSGFMFDKKTRSENYFKKAQRVIENVPQKFPLTWVDFSPTQGVNTLPAKEKRQRSSNLSKYYKCRKLLKKAIQLDPDNQNARDLHKKVNEILVMYEMKAACE